MRRSRWASAVAVFLLATSCGSDVAVAPIAAPTIAVAEAAGEFVSGTEGPVLGTPTGLHFALVAGGSIFDVDLDTGRIRGARLPVNTQVHRMFATTDGLFVGGFPTSGGGHVAIATRELDGFADTTLAYLSFLTGGTAWQVTSEKGTIDAREIDHRAGARRARSVAIENDRQAPFEDFEAAGVVGNELVLDARGHIVLVDVITGASRNWANGSVISVGGDRVVWRACTDDRTCATYVGTAANPRLLRLVIDGAVRAVCDGGYEGGTFVLCPIAISADGATMIGDESGAYVANRVTVWDLATGARQRIDWPTTRLQPRINTAEAFGVGGVVASPNGAWLFAVQTIGRVTAVERTTGRVVEFDVIKPVAKAEDLVTDFAIG